MTSLLKPLTPARLKELEQLKAFREAFGVLPHVRKNVSHEERMAKVRESLESGKMDPSLRKPVVPSGTTLD